MRKATSFAALAAGGLLAVSMSACGGATKSSTDKAASSAPAATQSGSADPSAPIKKGLTVGFLPKQVNNPYFNISDAGGNTALTSLGESYKEVGTTSATDTALSLSDGLRHDISGSFPAPGAPFKDKPGQAIEWDIPGGTAPDMPTRESERRKDLA